jgi:hypothetical protein
MCKQSKNEEFYMGDEFYRQYFYTAEMLEKSDVPGIGSWNLAVLSINCL